MIAITIQLTTHVSVIRMSPRTGIPVGIRKNILAQEISNSISNFTERDHHKIALKHQRVGNLQVGFIHPQIVI